MYQTGENWLRYYNNYCEKNNDTHQNTDLQLLVMKKDIKGGAVKGFMKGEFESNLCHGISWGSIDCNT